MAKRKPHKTKAMSSSGHIGLKRTADGAGYLLVHPRCVRERAEDIAEVREMVEAGELDIAVDELRWLLSGCSDFVEAHGLLGELALAGDEDVPLARGHFGTAYQLGMRAVRRQGGNVRLPVSQPANQPFFSSGQGLVWCLEKLAKRDMAAEVVDTLTTLDPADPLEVRKMFDTLATGGLPVVDLLKSFPQKP